MAIQPKNTNDIEVDTIVEKTPDAGVTAEGTLLKDNDITTADIIANDISASDIQAATGDITTLTTATLSPDSITTDSIAEKTPDSGVAIEGTLHKDLFIQLNNT
jgi:hypothetical protein